MLGNHFYHERLRKSVAVFGALFNNIYVIRKNSSNQVISQVKVPLSYAPTIKVGSYRKLIIFSRPALLMLLEISFIHMCHII